MVAAPTTVSTKDNFSSLPKVLGKILHEAAEDDGLINPQKVKNILGVGPISGT